ncbi:ArsR/SmtB family transcription factor [Pelagibacterium sp.]|uniref:ArsR/SmtB family transcription factor n=1 Tax=Pelagibacterium sp. TaxID=1967288 RepID=UPI003A9145FB
MTSIDPLSQVFGALADPTRRAILARLSKGQASVGQLADPHAMSLAAVSKHIKVLENAGLIARKKDAQFNYCTLTASPLKDLQGWLDAYRKFWDESLDQFEDYIAHLQRADLNSKQ